MRYSAEIVTNSPEVVVAHLGGICIGIPLGEPTMDMIGKLRGGMHALVKRNPGGIGLLFIVGEKSAPPSGPARQAAGEMFDSLRSQLKVVAAQLEGSGFMASAKRSIFTWATSNMLGKTPVKTFSKLRDGTDWLEAKSKELGVTCPTSDELLTLVHQVHLSGGG